MGTPSLCEDLLLTTVLPPTGNATASVSLLEQGLVRFKSCGSHLEAVLSSMEHLAKSRDTSGCHGAGCREYWHEARRGC